MHPILAKIGPLYVYSYGLMVAAGFATATFLVYRHAAEFGLNKDKIIDFGIAILIGGIAGARILYILLNMKYYAGHPFEIINLTKGGLIWYGAFIAGVIISFWFAKKNNMYFWNVGDLFAPYIALAQAFGRVGCLLNGCCYGNIAPSGYMLGIVFPGESLPRYPAQVFSAIALLLIFIALRVWQRKRHFTGEIFLGYILLYSINRFGMEFLRGDNPRMLYGLTLSQLISAVIFVLSLIIFVQRFFKWKKNSKSL